jgi:chromate transporter
MAPGDTRSEHQGRPTGSALSVFLAFLRLGLTSFGGPIAHLGYFRNAFVTRWKWVSEEAFADIVAVCQILPGPTSSQVGFAIGLSRAGPMGGLAAFAGFTAPSALLMIAAAFGASALPQDLRVRVFHGLVLVAVPIVAQAVIGMARMLCSTLATAAIGLAALGALLFVEQPWMQPLVIAIGAGAGLALPARPTAASHIAPAPRGPAFLCLGLFAALLLGLALLSAATPSPGVTLADAFYRSGALVFGGGHVVLPLLETETVDRGWISAESFLSGYGAAQALPGPLFSFAAYLGAASNTGLAPLAASFIALIALFLPGLLLVAGVVPLWATLRQHAWVSRLAAGASAAVVGVLAAALYRPVVVSAILGPVDAVIAIAGLLALMLRAPVWRVVAGVALAGF